MLSTGNFVNNYAMV